MSEFSVADELLKLKELLEKGILSQEEFEQQKEAVLKKGLKDEKSVANDVIKNIVKLTKKEDSKSSPSDVAFVNTEEPKPVPQPQKKPEPSAEKPKTKTPIIAIAAILAVCILAGVLFGTGVFGKKNSFKKVGSIVTFGSYKQDNVLASWKKPIEWIVLDVQDGKSLLVSKYALDARPYDKKGGVTWETCNLRTWLNDSFLKEAFSAEEQAKIPTVTVIADKNPSYDKDPGKDTRDRVFLLSLPEVERYFKSSAKRQCTPTAYAIAQESFGEQSLSTCWWWLRTPGLSSSHAACVDADGSVDYDGAYVSYSVAVRPALWINLAS